jgi:TonB family protein
MGAIHNRQRFYAERTALTTKMLPGTPPSATIPRMIRNAIVFALMLLFATAVSAETSTIKAVPAPEADSHIVQRVEPIIPPLAKAARIGGTVKLNIIISASGDVSSVRLISGHPMLAPSAIDTVKRWKYRPFLEDGKPVAVSTDIELTYPGGMSEHESAVRNKFFPIEDECRSLVNAGKYAEGELKCREAVEISNELPKDVILERSGARAMLANSIFLQNRYAEAVPIYEEALALDKGYLKPNDADLASDYENLGRAYAVTGDLTQADGLYATSVRTFEAAIENLPSMKDNYTRRLKRALNEYAQIKDAQGQSEAAEQLRKKAAGL